MRITFVLPHVLIAGGIRGPLEYANHLQDRGHDIAVVYPRSPLYLSQVRPAWRGIPGLLRKSKHEIRYWTAKLLGRNPIGWFDLKTKLLRAPNLSEVHIPEADVVVAIDWSTAEWVNRYERDKGEKFYLIQHYEAWGGPKHRVDATWKMPLNKIVVASWLKDLAEHQFGEQAFGPLTYGVNFNQFYPDNKANHPEGKRVGMLYHATDWKGVPDGIRAFEIARESHPDIQLVMFGTRKPKSGIPSYVEFHQNPPQAKLRRIYSSCDIWLSPSWTEGCQLVPMEAMACRCAVAATNVGGIPDYAVPGETALVSPPRDPGALAQNLIQLLEDETLLEKVARAGYERIKEFTWERSARQMEGYFREVLQRE